MQVLERVDYGSQVMGGQHLAFVLEKIGHHDNARLRSGLPQHTALFDVRHG